VAFLLDTSILIRLANRSDPAYPAADRAVAELHLRGELLHITPQNLIEFRNVATRPAAVNGLDLSTAEAEAKAADFEALFPMLPETPDVFPAWKALVGAAKVIGKQVHDARLVAVCHVHAVSHVLTFNVAHFAPLGGFGPGVAVVHPGSV
jgi:predicted nucleic acid-binding protein